MDLQIRVRKQVLTCRQVSIANSVNFVRATFQFDSEWNGTQKHVIFSNGDIPSVELLLDSTQSCIVPWEVLQEEGDLYISVVGILDDIKITTKLMDAPIKVYASGELGGSEPNPPTPSIWDQVGGVAIIEGTEEEPFDFNDIESLKKLKFGLNQIKGQILNAPGTEDELFTLIVNEWVLNVQTCNVNIPLEPGYGTVHLEVYAITTLPILGISSWTRTVMVAGDESEDSGWLSVNGFGPDYVESVALDPSADENHLSLVVTRTPISDENPDGGKRSQILINTKGIGRNSSLKTTDKSSLVAAINEVQSSLVAANALSNQPKISLSGNLFNRYKDNTSDAQETILTYDDDIKISSGVSPEVYGEVTRFGSNTKSVVAHYRYSNNNVLLIDGGASGLYRLSEGELTFVRVIPAGWITSSNTLYWASGDRVQLHRTASAANKISTLNTSSGAVSETEVDYYVSERVDPFVFQRLSSAVVILAFSDPSLTKRTWRKNTSLVSGYDATDLPNHGEVDSIFTDGKHYGWAIIEDGMLNFYMSSASTFRYESGTLKHSESYDDALRYSRFAYNEDGTKLYRYILEKSKYYLEERDVTTFEVVSKKLINSTNILPRGVEVENTCPLVFNGLLIARTNSSPYNTLQYFREESEEWLSQSLKCPTFEVPLVTSDNLFLCGSGITVITKKKKYNLM